MKSKLKPFHVGIAAEAYAAGAFAHAGCDVLIQYGANQPDYDFIAVRDDHSVKVSVKGSQDGGWGLIQNFKAGRGYHEAADAWAQLQSSELLYCLVQFQGVDLGELPRIYLASVADIAARHRESRSGHGATILWENYNYTRGIGKGAHDALPPTWRFSEKRLSRYLPPAG